jgi:hypothetical protein
MPRQKKVKLGDDRTEKQIQSSILYLLRVKRIPHSVTDVGLMRDQTGAFKFKRGTNGWPDISCVLPGGKFLGIEVKSAKGTLRGEQIVRHREITDLGGLILVARSADEVNEFLEKHLKL